MRYSFVIISGLFVFSLFPCLALAESPIRSVDSLSSARGINAPTDTLVASLQKAIVALEETRGLAESTHQTAMVERLEDTVNRSLAIFNMISTMLAVLVGLITLLVTFAAVFGFFDRRHREKLRSDVQTMADQVKKDSEAYQSIKEKAERYVAMLEKRVETLPFDGSSPDRDIREAEELRETVNVLDVLFSGQFTFQKLLGAGRERYLKKEYNEAIQIFDEAIKDSPDDDRPWSFKGLSLHRLGREAEAVEALRKATDLNPNNTQAWVFLGVVLKRLQRYEEASIAVQKAIAIDPRDAQAVYNAACYMSLLGRKSDALRYLERAIDINAKYKKAAKSDEDFKSLWDDDDFKQIVAP